MKLDSFCSQTQNRLFKCIADILSFLSPTQVGWGGTQLQEIAKADQANLRKSKDSQGWSLPSSNLQPGMLPRLTQTQAEVAERDCRKRGETRKGWRKDKGQASREEVECGGTGNTAGSRCHLVLLDGTMSLCQHRSGHRDTTNPQELLLLWESRWVSGNLTNKELTRSEDWGWKRPETPAAHPSAHSGNCCLQNGQR